MSRRSKLLAIVLFVPIAMALIQGCGKSEESYVTPAEGKGKPGTANTTDSKTATAE